MAKQLTKTGCSVIAAPTTKKTGSESEGCTPSHWVKTANANQIAPRGPTRNPHASATSQSILCFVWGCARWNDSIATEGIFGCWNKVFLVRFKGDHAAQPNAVDASQRFAARAGAHGHAGGGRGALLGPRPAAREHSQSCTRRCVRYEAVLLGGGSALSSFFLRAQRECAISGASRTRTGPSTTPFRLRDVSRFVSHLVSRRQSNSTAKRANTRCFATTGRT